MGEWMYSSIIFDLGTSWRQVVSFTALPFYTPGQRARRYPLDRRLGGPQSYSRHYKEEKNLLLVPVIEFRLLGRPANIINYGEI
jgi:hypothetical protein